MTVALIHRLVRLTKILATYGFHPSQGDLEVESLPP